MNKPGQLSIAVANNEQGVTINVTQHTSEWVSVLIGQGVAPLGDSIMTMMLHDTIGAQVPHIVEFVREYERQSHGQKLTTEQACTALSAFRSFQPRDWFNYGLAPGEGPQYARSWMSPALAMYLQGEPTHGELAKQLLAAQDELALWRQKYDELTLKVHELGQKGNP